LTILPGFGAVDKCVNTEGGAVSGARLLSFVEIVVDKAGIAVKLERGTPVPGIDYDLFVIFGSGMRAISFGADYSAATVHPRDAE
jgi:hypothetical protein